MKLQFLWTSQYLQCRIGLTLSGLRGHILPQHPKNLHWIPPLHKRAMSNGGRKNLGLKTHFRSKARRAECHIPFDSAWRDRKMSVCVYVCMYVCDTILSDVFLGDHWTELGATTAKWKVIWSLRTLLNGFGIGSQVPEIWPKQVPAIMGLEPENAFKPTKPIMRHLKRLRIQNLVQWKSNQVPKPHWPHPDMFEHVPDTSGEVASFWL